MRGHKEKEQPKEWKYRICRVPETALVLEMR